jgi:hypothetical protein
MNKTELSNAKTITAILGGGSAKTIATYSFEGLIKII